MARTYATMSDNERELALMQGAEAAKENQTQESPSLSDMTALFNGHAFRAQRQAIVQGLGSAYGNQRVARLLQTRAADSSAHAASAIERLPAQVRHDDEDDDEQSTPEESSEPEQTGDGEPTPAGENTGDENDPSGGDAGGGGAAGNENGDSPENENGDAQGDGEVVQIDPIEGEPDPRNGCEAVADSAEPGAAPTALTINTNLSLGSTLDESATSPRNQAKHDTVNSTVALSSTTPNTHTPGASAFGEELAAFSIGNITATRAGTVVNVNATIKLECAWGVHPLGRTDISGAADAGVTAATWSAIATDLTPDGSGRPTRTTYWCKDLTEKHEKFHASDDIAQAQLFLPTAKAFLDGQTINVPAGGSVDAPVSALLQTVRTNIAADSWAHYTSGGEDRAYADGKASYDARVAAIKAKATAAGWH